MKLSSVGLADVFFSGIVLLYMQVQRKEESNSGDFLKIFFPFLVQDMLCERSFNRLSRCAW